VVENKRIFRQKIKIDIMKRLFLISTLFCMLANVSVAQNIVGYWKGTLNLGPTELELCFDIKEENGMISATLDVPAQGAYDIPVTSISFEMMKLTMEIAPLNAAYEGTFVLNNIVGEFTQMGMSLPLTLIKGEKAAKPKRPQEPKEPFPYKSEEVFFKNTREDFTLAGTMTIPEGVALFNLINHLHEQCSVIITTNKSPSQWAETLDDEVLATAILDRLLYRCEVIKFEGNGYRMDNRKSFLQKE
jgi:hypothetical protein